MLKGTKDTHYTNVRITFYIHKVNLTSMFKTIGNYWFNLHISYGEI